MSDSSAPVIPRIMVFRPTLEEMKDFSKYLEYMESQGAHHGGLAKIIPPPEWVPRKAGYDNINITIKHPITQVVTGGPGAYQQINVQHRSMSFKEFKAKSELPKHRTPDYFDYDELEKKYWKNITYNSAIYGADVPGSLTDKDCKEFNINNLNTILDMINDSYGIKIMGVNTAYLYFGMWKSSFAWHTEDMDLYSINYLHFGAPKSWYCIPPEYGKKLEKLANELFSDLYQVCPAFLRHKMTLISPKVLKQYSIPFNKITQEEGEFMITFPYSYHAGYNHGLNCAESTNFALPRWIEYGKRATVCHCRKDTVKINMDVFVKVFQPDRYQNWLDGKDIGPDPKDPTNICAAPSPKDLENEYWIRTTKSRRQPYKRQLVEEANGTLALEECIDEFCNDDIVEDNDDSPDFCFLNRNGQRNNFKSGKKKKYNNQNKKQQQNKFINNNNINGCDEINYNDKSKNKKQNDSSNSMNDFQINNIDETKCTTTNKTTSDTSTNLVKWCTFSVEKFKTEEPSTLEELCLRTLQYTDNPRAFEDEIKFNYFTSLIDPFCSICILLRPFIFHRNLKCDLKFDLKPPKESQVLVPNSLIVSKLKQPLQYPYPEHQDKQVQLLVCNVCKLCVHASCYGVVDMASNPKEWKCDRCLINDLEAACCLCPMRGGALKPTICNKWAHLTCAMVINQVKIESHALLKPIDISGVQLESDRIACNYCSQKSKHGRISNYIIGLCIRCNNSNSCYEYFHVTCGHREGVLFELNDNLTAFKFVCKKCQLAKINRGKELLKNNMDEIECQMMVIAKYNSQAYSYAKVNFKYEEIFHHVQFVDNTFVNNIRSNDILNRDCERDKPMIGDPVEVIWNKEQLHGKYAGCHLTQMYTVQFDNNHQVNLDREDLYLLNEEIPKRVQMKFTDSLKCLE